MGKKLEGGRPWEEERVNREKYRKKERITSENQFV